MAIKRLTAALIALSFAGTAAAVPNGTALFDTFNNIADDGVNDVNVYTDMISDDLDALWTLDANGVGSATIIVELAGFAGLNKFGVYSGSDYVELFAGAAAAGDKALLHIDASGSVFTGTLFGGVSDTGVDFAANQFGFYLNSPQGIFHSETDKNTDGVDHMLAYQGVGENVTLPDGISGPWASNEYILGFEDLYGGGDQDYADFVVMIESISPIPEPGLAALLGVGLIGLGLSRRKNYAA
ncbi:MAG: DUF4114 domain-containing protein [Gammaproteobacteria bacterium]